MPYTLLMAISARGCQFSAAIDDLETFQCQLTCLEIYSFDNPAGTIGKHNRQCTQPKTTTGSNGQSLKNEN